MCHLIEVYAPWRDAPTSGRPNPDGIPLRTLLNARIARIMLARTKDLNVMLAETAIGAELDTEILVLYASEHFNLKCKPIEDKPIAGASSLIHRIRITFLVIEN